VSTGYWWYPETVYCPTYLTVPSTVVVIDDREGPDGELVSAPAPAPAGGVVRETIVAGGGIVGTARISDRPADATTEAMAIALAVKYVELGDFYFRADRFADAVEAYGKARSYAPDDASVHFVLADAAFANGDYHYAAFLIAEALRLDPSLAAADTDKRTFYTDAKVFDAQLLALDAYLEKKPYDAQAHLVRGYNLRFSAQPAAAQAAFRRVLEIAPDNRAAQTFLGAMAAAGATLTDR
jgi:tetratricopeptide (TPR) repeat protein